MLKLCIYACLGLSAAGHSAGTSALQLCDRGSRDVKPEFVRPLIARSRLQYGIGSVCSSQSASFVLPTLEWGQLRASALAGAADALHIRTSATSARPLLPKVSRNDEAPGATISTNTAPLGLSACVPCAFDYFQISEDLAYSVYGSITHRFQCYTLAVIVSSIVWRR